MPLPTSDPDDPLRLHGNAGGGGGGGAMDCSEEDWEFGMRLNAFSPFICIKYALPHMLKSVRTTATRLAAVGPACGLSADCC